MESEIKFIYCLFQRYQQIHCPYQQPRGIKPLSGAYLFRAPKSCGLEEAESEFSFHSPWLCLLLHSCKLAKFQLMPSGFSTMLSLTKLRVAFWVHSKEQRQNNQTINYEPSVKAASTSWGTASHLLETYCILMNQPLLKSCVTKHRHYVDRYPQIKRNGFTSHKLVLFLSTTL
jgi:hypothetical protein